MIHKYNSVMVKDNISRTDDVISLIISRPENFSYSPGEFIMVWVPSVNEKPFAVSSLNEDSLEITIRIIGDFTKHILQLKKGDMIGIRGPFGNGFCNISADESLIVTGGVGIACMSLLALKYPEIPLLYGSKTKDDIIFPDRFNNCIYATDDGSYGKKGLITDIFADYIKDNNIKTVYSCGPEKMLYSLYLKCRELDIRLYASLERYMKCGVGVCGQCALDDMITCIDGPVFDDETLSSLKEFGKIRYNKAGQRENI